MAPVDLIISLLNTHIENETFDNYKDEFPDNSETRAYVSGRKDALEDFRNELSNLKKLFN